MRLTSEQDLDDLHSAFEGGTLPKAEWTHAAHLAVAAILVWDDPATALSRARSGIPTLNERQGTRNTDTSGYHETLTVFWVAMVRAYCAAHRDRGRLAAISQIIAAFPSNLYQQYYGFDVVGSTAARKQWVEPDLQPLP